MAFKALLAAGIPLCIMTAIGGLLISQGDHANGRSTIAVGVIAAAVSGSALVYQVPTWSLKRQSLTHLGIMVVTVLPALLASGWFDLSTPWGWVLVIGLFAAAGAVLWTFFYLLFAVIKRVRGTRTVESEIPGA